MANPEHLKILKQGVEAWNKWYHKHLRVTPELSDSQLPGLDLRGAILTKANLGGTDLRGADLSGSTLIEAYLIDADLGEANLGGANLSAAELYAVNLTEATLKGAYLFGANLHKAYLIGADLRDADLSHCNLVETDLTWAKLTGARLYGTARDAWIIEGVKCKYVYWDEERKQRSPKDRDLEPGEFERLYASLPTIEFIFEKGMTPIDPFIMDRVVQAIRERRPEFDIKIDSINARGLAPSIKFTVQHEEHKEPALEEVREVYESKIKQLESERNRIYHLLERSTQEREKALSIENVESSLIAALGPSKKYMVDLQTENEKLFSLLAKAMDANRLYALLLSEAIRKAGDYITVGPDSFVATRGSTINIQQHIHNAVELQGAIAKEPEDSKSFAKVAKKKALDIIGGVIEDIAKGQVKEATKQIIELGKELGPVIVKTAAYGFFKSMWQ